MLKKGIVLLFSVLFISFSLFAGGAQEEAQANDKEFSGAEINFLWYPSAEMDAIKKMLPEFEAETGIKVTLTEVPHEEVFKKRYFDAISGADEFDIYPLQPPTLRTFAENDYIVPLSDFWDTPDEFEYDDIFDGVKTMYEYKGKIYGVPLYPDVIMLFYNKKMVEEAGQTVPETFKDFERVCKSFIKDTNNDGTNDKWGSVLNLKGGDWSIMNNLSLFLYLNEADWFYGQIAADLPVENGEQYRSALNEPKAVEALEYLVKLYQSEVFSPGSINYSYFEAMENFSTGKVPFYIGFADQAPMITGEDSLISEDVRAVKVPGWKGNTGTFTGGWGAAISANSNNKEAAYAFLKFFYGNSENQKKLAGYGQTPIRKSVLFDEELQKQFVWFEAMGQMLEVAKPLPLINEWDEFTSKLEPILTEALLDRITSEEAMKRSSVEFENIMERAGYYE